MPVITDDQKSLWINSIKEADFYNVRVKLSSDTTQWDDVTPQAFPDTLDDPETGETEFELGSITALNGVDGLYDFAISAAENNGQESTYFIVEAQQIDFLLPEAPSRGGVR